MREVSLLEADGQPYFHVGRIPPAQQYLEVAVEASAPIEVCDRIATFVRRVDPLHRRVELRHDDVVVKQVEQSLLIRWKLLRWIRLLFRGSAPVKAT